MPFKGKCPNSNCDWTYDVHKELKKSITKRDDEAGGVIRCPVCREPINTKLTVCASCGKVIIGTRSFKKIHILGFVAAVLVIVSLVVKYLF